MSENTLYNSEQPNDGFVRMLFLQDGKLDVGFIRKAVRSAVDPSRVEDYVDDLSDLANDLLSSGKTREFVAAAVWTDLRDSQDLIEWADSLKAEIDRVKVNREKMLIIREPKAWKLRRNTEPRDYVPPTEFGFASSEPPPESLSHSDTADDISEGMF